MKLHLFVCTSIVLAAGLPVGTGQTAQAQSITPKPVAVDVNGWLSGPTAEYGYLQIALVGKSHDDLSLAQEYFFDQRYLVVQHGMTFGSLYSGPSGFLVLSVYANGFTGAKPGSSMSFTIDGDPFTIAMPPVTFTDGGSWFSMYVADDGSTYYARRDHLPGRNDAMIAFDRVADSLDLSPSQAFAIDHLAATIPEPATITLLTLGGLLLLRPRHGRLGS